MVSKNTLLGSGKVEEEEEIKSEVTLTEERLAELAAVANVKIPAWRFRKDHPEGKLVKTYTELMQLDADGWVDHPGKCTLLPGFEDVYEGEKE